MFTTRALFSRIANGNDITLWEKKDDDGAPEREDTRRIVGDVYGIDGLSADVDNSNDFEINDVLVEDKRIRNGEAKYLSRDFVKMWLETKISEGRFIWRPEHGDFGLPHPVIGDMPIGLSDASRILGRFIRGPRLPNRAGMDMNFDDFDARGNEFRRENREINRGNPRRVRQERA